MCLSPSANEPNLLMWICAVRLSCAAMPIRVDTSSVISTADTSTTRKSAPAAPLLPRSSASVSHSTRCLPAPRGPSSSAVEFSRPPAVRSRISRKSSRAAACKCERRPDSAAGARSRAYAPRRAARSSGATCSGSSGKPSSSRSGAAVGTEAVGGASAASAARWRRACPLSASPTTPPPYPPPRPPPPPPRRRTWPSHPCPWPSPRRPCASPPPPWPSRRAPPWRRCAYSS
mmetsp:Transcript_34802/g.112153  ORF Transcript_34802/g.112153 Transcript_34802/m.112153 type:complete len:231 (-) Transcript_34802:1103-1795(-)